MKKPIIITILLLAHVIGFGQGVTVFNDGDIYAALQQAKRDKKLLLVEFYAERDYRSRWMNDMINDSRIAVDAIENDFIFFQFDTQNEQGASYANRYSVTTYPCLLVFNRNGDVIYKIDKAYEAKDFAALLNTVLLEQNGSVVWKMTQIDNAIENQDSQKADELFEQLETTIGNDIFDKHYWRLFEESTITFFNSQSYSILTRHKDKFEVDSSIVNNRILTILRNAISPILVESQPYDSTQLEIIGTEIKLLKINDPQLDLMISMIENRRHKEYSQYVYNCEKLLNMISDDKGYNIVLTLDCIVESGSKDQKHKAKKIIDNQIQRTPIGSQIELLDHLLNKL